MVMTEKKERLTIQEFSRVHLSKDGKIRQITEPVKVPDWQADNKKFDQVLRRS